MQQRVGEGQRRELRCFSLIGLTSAARKRNFPFLLVIIADALQNAMAAEYRSITEGLILISTILGWNLLLDWAGWRFRPLRRFLSGPELFRRRKA